MSLHKKTLDLKDHADGEANPGAHGASDGGDEGGERVAGGLFDRLHVQRHEVDLQTVRSQRQTRGTIFVSFKRWMKIFFVDNCEKPPLWQFPRWHHVVL